MSVWRYPPDQLPSNVDVAAARAGEPELGFDTPARDGRGQPGHLGIGARHLFWAQAGSDAPAVAIAVGIASLVAGIVLSRNLLHLRNAELLFRAGVGLLIVGSALVAAGGSLLAAFRTRRGVLTVPLERVSPALTAGRVWVRDRGRLLELEPLGLEAAEEVELALGGPRSPAAVEEPADLTPLFLRVAGWVVLTAVVIGLATVIPLNVFFSRTLPAGGDMGSHHYIPQQLEHFLPLRLSGWSDGWYAGFPMLHFYFPLPYLVIVLLQKIVGYGFAFRLVSLAGVVGFPFACFWCLRWCQLPDPVPAVGAAAGFVFVTGETYSILGGNIASTMAGEFPFSISLTLSVFLIGLLWRGTRTGKGLAPAAMVFGALLLCHVVPLMMVVPAGALILLGRPRRLPRQFGFLAAATGIGVLLAALWLLPFLSRVGYTARAVWIHDLKDNYLFGGPVCANSCHRSVTLIVLVLAAVLGLFVAAFSRHGPPFVFAAVAVLMAILAAVLPEGALLNTRALPFYYTMVVLGGSYGLGMGLRILVMDLARAPEVLPALAVVLAGTLIVGGASEIRFIRGWVTYNYSGYEAKQGAAEYQELMATLRTLPNGRILWEYNGDYERFGTTRSLELIPYWTHQPSMEGLLVESSITAPFHFIMQNETSLTGTGAVPGLRYPTFDFERGLAHARLYDIAYFVAFTDSTKEAARKANLELATSSGHFDVFRVSRPGVVSVPAQQPVVAAGRDWYSGGLDWFCFSDLSRLVVFPQGGEGTMLQRLPHLPAPPPATVRTNNGVGGKYCGRTDHKLNDDLVHLPAGPPLPVGQPQVQRSSDGVIEFDTNQIGVPHVVSVSWFPTWKAEGAEGPYLVSPSLMMVIPTQRHVRLTEGRRGLDWAGVGLSGLGLALLVGLTLWQRRRGLLFAPPAGDQRAPVDGEPGSAGAEAGEAGRHGQVAGIAELAEG